jgi:RNA polymerase sigma-70 factor (ECF subfamily)
MDLHPSPDDTPLHIGASDGSLLRRIQSGEEEAATQLYLRYSQRLMQLARANTAPELGVRFDPEDVVQSVFRSFFRRASGGCYDVPEGGELWRLLLVLALNKVRGLALHHRARKRDVSQTVGSAGLEDLAGRHEGQCAEPVKILELVIEELLSNMPEVQRQMVELRIEGCSVGEIATRTKRSKRTVERVLQSFREQLAALTDETDHSQ